MTTLTPLLGRPECLDPSGDRLALRVARLVVRGYPIDLVARKVGKSRSTLYRLYPGLAARCRPPRPS